MNKQKGFTLVELIVVIIILAILAVTAFPRMMNMQKEARRATLSGLAGSLKGGLLIAYGKASANGLDGASSGTVSAGGGAKVSIAYGAPTAAVSGIIATLANSVDFSQKVSDTDWIYAVSGSPAQGASIYFTLNKPGTAGAPAGTSPVTVTNISDAKCYVVYHEAKAREEAYVTATLLGSDCTPD